MTRLLELALAASLFVAPQEDSTLQAPLASLQNDPDLRRFSWTERSAPGYSPFLLLAADEPDANPAIAQELESSFGPLLTALVDLWRSEWTQPLDLSPASPGARAALAFLPSFDIHKQVATKKLPDTQTVPSSYMLGEVALTYLHGNAFESKAARRNAVLARAAERLLALYEPAAASKQWPAWLKLGLASYLGDLRQRDEGREEPYFGREENKDWREARARAAEELKELKIAAPSLEEIMKLGPDSTLEAKPRAYREYVRLSGYAWLLLYRAQQTEKLAKPLRAFLKDEFRGEGGIERFRTLLQGQAATFLKEWEAFCRTGAAGKAPAPPPISSLPPAKKDAPSAGKLSPVALDMTPRTPVDVHAEVIRKIRSARFDEALHEAYDVREKQSAVAKPYLAAEKKMIETASSIYEAFGNNCKPGDRLTADYGHAGVVSRCYPDGSFDLREKSGLVRRRWTDLSLQAVANYAYEAMKRSNPEQTMDYATAMLLCGNLEAARTAIAKSSASGGSTQRAAWLQAMLPEFERALQEAKARDAFEEIAALDLPHAIERLRVRLLDTEIRTSAAREYATPFLEGMISVYFGEQFDKKGLPGFLRGKLTQGKGGMNLRYDFEDEAELADWEPVSLPELENRFEAGKEAGSFWECAHGDLRLLAFGARSHVIPWSGDWTVQIEVEIETPDASAPVAAPPRGLLVGVIEEGKSRFLCSLDAEESPGPSSWTPGAPHAWRLVRAGERVHFFFDGKGAGSLDAKGFGAGKVFFFSPGDARYVIREIVFSGMPDTHSEWYRTKKSNWVQREIEGILPR